MPRAVVLLLLLGFSELILGFQAGVTLPPEHLAALCGDCAEGKVRERSLGPYCGRCVPATQTCAIGFFWEDTTSKCEGCPCRVFDTSCMKDTDGQITCRCPREYEGRWCERCSPGFVQESHYPYKCIEIEAKLADQPLPPLPSGCPTDLTSIQGQGRVVRQAGAYPTGCPAIPVPAPPGAVVPVPSAPTSPYCPPAPACIPGTAPYCPPAPPCVPGTPTQYCPPAPPCVPGTPGPYCPPAPPCIPGTPAPGQYCPPPPTCIPGGVNPCPIQPCFPGTPGCPPYPYPPPPPYDCRPWPTTPTPPWPTPSPPWPTPSPPWPTPAPPVITCPPQLSCPPYPPYPPYPSQPPVVCPIQPINCPSTCPTIPSCPPNPGCPIIPACPPIPGCPDIPPWPQIPKCPEIPPCVVPPCPPMPALVCNVTCGCCDKDTTGKPPIPPTPISVCTLCDPRGTVRQEGSDCICKVNVEGAYCNTCKRGYFGLRKGNEQGCSKCFCSGVTDYCTSAIMYRDSRYISMSAVNLVDRTGNSIPLRYTAGTAELTFESGMSGEYYWLLPTSEVGGNRVSSYGSRIEAIRDYSTGLMSTSVPGNDVIIEGSNGVSLFWSAEKPCPADTETELLVRIQESDNWLIWRNGKTSLATREDIMGVLASVERILIRAAFTPTRMKKSSIRKVRFGTGAAKYTADGFTLQVEDCHCPDGYQGLSCENCAPGFYRDNTDMTRSVFGSCKKCPCRKNSDGCKLEFGALVCICKSGYSGLRCEDKDYISVTLDPSRVRDCIGESITFNCTYTSSSLVRLEFDTIPSSFNTIETTSFSNGISTTMKIGRSVERLVCKVLDPDPYRSFLIAEVYSRIDPQDCVPAIKQVMGPLIRVEASNKFECVEEGNRSVTFNCAAWSFASRQLRPTWSRAGTKSLPRSAEVNEGVLRIRDPVVDDSGTYYCSGEDSSQVQLDSVVLVVKRRYQPVSFTFDEQDDAPFADTDYPNYNEVIEDPSDFAELEGPSEESIVNVTLTTTTPFPVHSAEGPPSIYVSVLPSELSVVQGQSAEFKCNVAGETEELTLYWRKRNGTIRTDVSANGSVLHFNSVRKIHEGEYHCVASNKIGKNSDSAYLRVVERGEEEAPAAPDTRTIALQVSVLPLYNDVPRPGDKIILTCDSNEKDLKFIWSKENDTIRYSMRDEFNEGHLIMPSVIPSDSGWYICAAISSSDPSRTGTGRVQLIVKPEEIAPTVVISEKSPLSAKLGYPVHLECQTFGEPIPVVTWSRFISTADGYQEQTLLEATTPNLVYQIRHVVKEHEGDYFCTARNEKGQDRVSIRLEVDEGITCASNQFRCHSGDQCVNIEDRCDKEKDCRDGSDEKHCHHRRARMISPNI